MLSVEMGLRELASLKVFFFFLNYHYCFLNCVHFSIICYFPCNFPEMCSVKIRYMCALRVISLSNMDFETLSCFLL
jgi:hypothetical protein